MDGDDLDIDAVIASRCETRAHGQPDERIYAATAIRGRDLSVVILIDGSSSVAKDSPHGDRVHDHQLELVDEVASALDTLGFRSAIYCFWSLGRRHVQLLRAKGFNARFDATARLRLAALEPSGLTGMGAAVRACTLRLVEGAGTRHKILVVISDGHPRDDGYELEYAASDTRRAVEEARAAGVGCLCLSIGGEQDTKNLAGVFGSAAIVSASNVPAICNGLGQLVHTAVTCAEGRASLRIAAQEGA